MITCIGFYTVMVTIYHNHCNMVNKREVANSFSFLCDIISVLSYVINMILNKPQWSILMLKASTLEIQNLLGKQPYAEPKRFGADNRLYLDEVGSYLQFNEAQKTISLHITGQPPIANILGNFVDFERIKVSAITAVLINCKKLVMNLVDTIFPGQNTIIVYDVTAGQVTLNQDYLGLNATLLIDDRYNQNADVDVALIYIGPSMEGPVVIDDPYMPA